MSSSLGEESEDDFSRQSSGESGDDEELEYMSSSDGFGDVSSSELSDEDFFGLDDGASDWEDFFGLDGIRVEPEEESKETWHLRHLHKKQNCSAVKEKRLQFSFSGNCT